MGGRVPVDSTLEWRDAAWWTRHLAAQRRLLNALPPGPFGRFLDVGCGMGALGVAFHERYPEAQICAIDVDPERVAEAQATLAERGIGAKVVRADARELPFPDGGHDVVAMASVLHWLHPQRERALSEAARVLRPGGYFVLLNMIRKAGVRQFTAIVDHLAAEAASRTGVSARALPSFDERHYSLPGLVRALEHSSLMPIRTDSWQRRLSFASGAAFHAFIARTMGTFYWSDLSPDAARSYQDAFIAAVDNARAGATFDIPVCNVIVCARRSV